MTNGKHCYQTEYFEGVNNIKKKLLFPPLPCFAFYQTPTFSLEHMDKSPKIKRFSDFQSIPNSGPMKDTFSGIADLQKKNQKKTKNFPKKFLTRRLFSDPVGTRGNKLNFNFGLINIYIYSTLLTLRARSHINRCRTFYITQGLSGNMQCFIIYLPDLSMYIMWLYSNPAAGTQIAHLLFHPQYQRQEVGTNCLKQ